VAATSPLKAGADGPEESIGQHLADYAPSATDQKPAVWLRRAAVLLPVLFVAGVTLGLIAGRRSSGSTATSNPAASLPDGFSVGACAAPEKRPDNPTQEQKDAWKAADQAALDEFDQTGWGKTRVKAQDGTYVCGYFHSAPPSLDDFQGGPDALNKILYQSTGIYDSPNGKLLGLSYSDLGYFSMEAVNSPGFDPSKLRLERFGCDPTADAKCQPPMAR
jgi:hypothetical protein